MVVVYTQKTFYCMPGKSGMRKEGKKELVMNVVFLSYLGDIFLKKWFCQWAVAPN